MKLRAAILSTALLAVATLSIASAQTAEAQPPPPPQAEDNLPPPPPAASQSPEVRRFVDMMNAIANGASCMQGTVTQVQTAATGRPPAPPRPRVDKPLTGKNTMALISAGAASGAAIGAVVSRDSRGPMYGAIAGGAAGLIYDLITRSKEASTY